MCSYKKQAYVLFLRPFKWQIAKWHTLHISSDFWPEVQVIKLDLLKNTHILMLFLFILQRYQLNLTSLSIEMLRWRYIAIQIKIFLMRKKFIENCNPDSGSWKFYKAACLIIHQLLNLPVLSEKLRFSIKCKAISGIRQ